MSLSRPTVQALQAEHFGAGVLDDEARRTSRCHAAVEHCAESHTRRNCKQVTSMKLRPILALVSLLIIAILPVHSALSRECELDRPITLAGLDWNSNQFHMAVVKRILRDGYGCPVKIRRGKTKPLQNALLTGDVDVMLEVWGDAVDGRWEAAIEDGDIVDLGVNFPDSTQGWYVPRYMLEGPDAPAPDLKSVTDLPRYAHLFEDPKKPGKGRFYNCVRGWLCEDINTRKLRAYGLDKHFTNIRPKNSASLAAAIVRASRLQKPVLAYYWEPTWLIGTYDLVRLEEPRYDVRTWSELTRDTNPTQGVAYPRLAVRKAVSSGFRRYAPAATRFLNSYRTDSDLISEGLAYVQEVEGATPDDAAREFLATKEDIWSKWVPDDVVESVKAKL
jgi:glycine betaine/proline transport system substrate-binding protein